MPYTRADPLCRRYSPRSSRDGRTRSASSRKAAIPPGPLICPSKAASSTLTSALIADERTPSGPAAEERREKAAGLPRPDIGAGGGAPGWGSAGNGGVGDGAPPPQTPFSGKKVSRTE